MCVVLQSTACKCVYALVNFALCCWHKTTWPFRLLVLVLSIASAVSTTEVLVVMKKGRVTGLERGGRWPYVPHVDILAFRIKP